MAKNLAPAGQFSVDGAVAFLPPPRGYYRYHCIAAGTAVARFRDNTDLSFPVSAPSTSVPLQAQLQDNNDVPVPPKVSPSETTQGNWQSYQVQTGKTLAQLFRDNNLPVNDVFAMAQVEGSDKPLSNLKAGQEVKIMLDAQGAVTALAIETPENTEVLFSRQNDGSYRREH